MDRNEDDVTYLQVLKNRYFALYTLTEIFTIFGSASSGIAFILLAFGDIGSILNAGAYRIARVVPTLILGLIVGVYVDRWGKKRSYMISSLLCALIVLIPIFYRDIITIISVALVLSTLSLFTSSAHEAILPMILDKEKLTTGNSVIRVAVTGGGVMAPTLAVYLIDFHGYWIVFLLDFLTYIVDVVCLYYIPLDEEMIENEEKGVKGIISDIKASIGHVKERSTVAFILIVGFFTSLIVGGFSLYVLDYVDILFETRLPFGYYTSASFLGSFVGGLFTGKYLQNTKYKYLISASLVFYGFGLIGLVLLPFMFSFFLFGMIFGLGNAVIGIATETGMQSLCDQEFLGRITSLHHVISHSGTIGSLIIAIVLIRLIGPEISMLGVGTILIIFSFISLLKREEK